MQFRKNILTTVAFQHLCSNRTLLLASTSRNLVTTIKQQQQQQQQQQHQMGYSKQSIMAFRGGSSTSTTSYLSSSAGMYLFLNIFLFHTIKRKKKERLIPFSTNIIDTIKSFSPSLSRNMFIIIIQYHP